jgi:hypothetical protein
MGLWGLGLLCLLCTMKFSNEAGRQAGGQAGGRAAITLHLFLKRSFVNSQVTGRLRCTSCAVCTSCAGVLSVVCSLFELQLLLLTPLLLSSPPHTHTQ